MWAKNFSQQQLGGIATDLFHKYQLHARGIALLKSRVFWAAALALISLLGVAFGLDGLGLAGKTSLVVFAWAMIAWSILRLDETPVAIAGGLALVIFKATTAENFYAGMGDDLVWLLIASFILAAVLQQSGVAQRLVMQLLGAKDKDLQLGVRPLFTRVTWMIIATAFVVPSTSGRAALLVPVYLLLAQNIQAPSVRQGLALLFPTAILLSACASLLGAGAHLVAIDFMTQMQLPNLSYAHWALLGTPFALASCFAAMQLIVHLFVKPEALSQTIVIKAEAQAPLTREQWAVIGVTASTVLLWAIGPQFGLQATMVALLAVLAATTKALTGVALKAALKAVEWNLILFLAATMVMGEALLHSGAAQALADQAQALMPSAWRSHDVGVVLFVSLVSLLAHCVITSRTARAMVLLPTIAVPLAIGDISAQALIFVAVVASGFCQTFTVSAKPVAMFATQTESAFSAQDLWRLSTWLLPVMLGLLLVFALIVWPLLGLPLSTNSAHAMQCLPGAEQTLAHSRQVAR
jgi:solute carrier family 13 (sodium-dependent dicarboxylate transporter), member 2/3/5